MVWHSNCFSKKYYNLVVDNLLNVLANAAGILTIKIRGVFNEKDISIGVSYGKLC